MVDIHCHILPKLDDGPPDIPACLEMAKNAVCDGISNIIATPHHLNGKYENIKQNILDCVKVVNEHLTLEKVPITVHPGQEVRIHREIFISLKRDELLTLNNKGKYLLLELPTHDLPAYTRDVIYELLLKGITPVIVHPERNQAILENQNLLFELVQDGALTQLTSGSVIGHFGKRIKSLAEKIIEHNLAHLIATDAHNINSRGFTLQESYQIITQVFGIKKTFYFKENAELLLNNQNLYVEHPVPIKKKYFKIFKI